MLCRHFFILFCCLFFSSNSIAVLNDSATNLIINQVHYSGNKITKPIIISRELMFKSGDTISAAALSEVLQKTKENLLNTSLFNFVSVDTVILGESRIDVNITFAERWYTWPVPIFDIAERNFNTWWETRNLNRAIYGFYVTRNNFRGRKESLTFIAKFGYVQQYGLTYQIPYITRKQNVGLGFAVNYSRNHEIAYNTFNNQLLYYKDPTKYIRSEIASRLNFTHRQGIYNTHYVEFRYNKGNIDDTLQNLTSDYFVNNKTVMEYFSAEYLFRRDYRDSKAYPLKGYYFDFLVDKQGLGVLENESLNLLYFQTTLRQYWKMGQRFYPEIGVRGRLSATHTQPYYAQRALGFRDYVRGYEYYVIDGQSYALGKAEIRFELVKPRVQKIPFLPLEKFNKVPYSIYLGIFSDVAYVEDKINFNNNFLANGWLVGTGLGIDFVTYYDTVLRVEYSLNKRGESGFFIHLSAPI